MFGSCPLALLQQHRQQHRQQHCQQHCQQLPQQPLWNAFPNDCGYVAPLFAAVRHFGVDLAEVTTVYFVVDLAEVDVVLGGAVYTLAWTHLAEVDVVSGMSRAGGVLINDLEAVLSGDGVQPTWVACQVAVSVAAV